MWFMQNILKTNWSRNSLFTHIFVLIFSSFLVCFFLSVYHPLFLSFHHSFFHPFVTFLIWLSLQSYSSVCFFGFFLCVCVFFLYFFPFVLLCTFSSSERKIQIWSICRLILYRSNRIKQIQIIFIKISVVAVFVYGVWEYLNSCENETDNRNQCAIKSRDIYAESHSPLKKVKWAEKSCSQILTKFESKMMAVQLDNSPGHL